MPEQYYLFTLPGDDLVWCEMYTSDGHFVAPTPYTSVPVALAYLSERYPDATVDWFDDRCLQADIDQVRTWARECPLEPLPV